MPLVEYVRAPEENGSSCNRGADSEVFVTEGACEVTEYVLGNGWEERSRMDWVTVG